MKREETESKILEKIEEENKALSEKKKTELEQQRIEEQELIASLDERLESKQRELAVSGSPMIRSYEVHRLPTLKCTVTSCQESR
jgi:2-succinyl-5-enolpyruvyl-6-hydroxy-3-cyclohexene-1-carboxylate synthase